MRLSYFLFSIIGSVCLILLSGCFSSESEQDGVSTLFQTDQFALQPAPNWVSMNISELGSEVPSQTVAAFTAQNTASDVLKTMTVVTENIPVEVPDKIAYANANIGQAMEQLINYEKVEIAEVDIAGQKTKIHVFRGKLKPEDSISLFIQTYLVNRQKGYILTGVLLSNAEQLEIDELKTMMMSFIFMN